MGVLFYMKLKKNQTLTLGLIIYPFVNAYFSDIFEGPYRILSIIFIAIIPLALMMYKSFTQKKKNALI